MWQHLYVRQKLRELERERPARRDTPAKPQTDPMTARVTRMMGRLLCRMGEGLESWAAPSQAEGRWGQERHR
jgi:hypothetical protein